MNKAKRYENVTSKAAESKGYWSNKEVAQFHYFNENGVIKSNQAVYDRLMEIVESGELPSGWLLVHERYNINVKTITKLATESKKVCHIQLEVAIEGVIEKAQKLADALEANGL